MRVFFSILKYPNRLDFVTVDYAKEYETLNDETANTLATATLKNNMQLEKLYKKYFVQVAYRI